MISGESTITTASGIGANSVSFGNSCVFIPCRKRALVSREPLIAMDVFDQKKRSEIMRSVKSKDSRAELAVRRTLHRLGYRFRLHRTDLPGKPDIVLPRHRVVVLVHGCFWHQHRRCKRAARPTSNTAFWNRKLDRNEARDRTNGRRLRSLGWRVVTIWECQTADPTRLERRLASAC